MTALWADRFDLQPIIAPIKCRMNFRAAICTAAGVLAVSGAHASEEQPKKPGIISRVMNVFHGKKQDDKAAAKSKNFSIAVQVAPQPLKLSDTRQVAVTVVLTNKSKKFVQLEFPTTQRIEVLIRDRTGKLVTQWSEDQRFENAPSYVSLNPGERVEYSVNLPTRDLKAGQEYLVEGFFPNFEDLKAHKALVPQG
jgi:intracellular proteinase inhibitor BsuPI